MQYRKFHNCCTGIVLFDFGNTVTSGGRVGKVEYETLIKEAKQAAINIDRFEGAKNMAIISAMTNSDQKPAIKLLRKLGFKGSKWVSKNQHKTKKVKIWYCEASVFFNNVENL